MTTLHLTIVLKLKAFSVSPQSKVCYKMVLRDMLFIFVDHIHVNPTYVKRKWSSDEIPSHMIHSQQQYFIFFGESTTIHLVTGLTHSI